MAIARVCSMPFQEVRMHNTQFLGVSDPTTVSTGSSCSEYFFFGSARGSRRYKEKRYDDTAGLRSESPGPEDSSVSAQRCWKAWSHPLSPLIFSLHQESRKMKIAVLTSGGDSAGMNAVVRGVVRAGIVKFAASCPILRPPHPCLSIRPFLCPPSQRMRDLGRSRRIRRSRPWK